MPARSILYVYPLNKLVSFRFIAESHVRELRKYFSVQVFDERSFAIIAPMVQYAHGGPILIQPYFYQMQAYENRLLAKVGRPERLIGVDVADSDHVSQEAVRLVDYSTAMIVPSEFSRRSYVGSGVGVPVHVVPHGVTEDYLDQPPSRPSTFKPLLDYKLRNRRRLIQIWLLHSSYRKGEDIAYRVFNRLLADRKDVSLVVRRPLCAEVYDSEIDLGKPRPSHTVPASWLTDGQVRELMDVCDLYLLTSRGGAFEHPPLQALARGEPVVGARGGAWEDYLPEWALIPSKRSGQVLANNPIHDGYGVEMEVEPAVTKLHEILDDLDDYRARVRHHVDTCVRERFTWERIGLQLRDTVAKYL
jgi:glycosyltransferase involved in cell wall biosynthesis